MRICYSDEAINICKGLVTFLRAWYAQSHPHFVKMYYSQQNKKGEKKLTMKYQHCLMPGKKKIFKSTVEITEEGTWEEGP